MAHNYFKRKIYDQMLLWKKESNGDTALLIKGARRIGKSTIAEAFASREYKSYILIDFAIAPPAILELFSHIYNLDFFFLRLKSITNVTLYERNSVIIFDEVQLFPPARQAIKHLVKDHRYDYIETGSLLSIKKNVKDIVIPSEETRISMYPMDLEEFLWATGKTPTYDLITYSFKNRKPTGDSVTRNLMSQFRLYMLIGGMPQAVDTYLKNKDFAAVDKIKRQIIELYLDDFRKIDSMGRASRLFKSIPAQLSRNTTRYKVGSVIDNATATRLAEVLEDIADSMTVNFAYHANDPSVGFSLHANYDHFKMYLADTGLLVTLAFMDKSYTENKIYNKLLSDKLGADLGFIYENAVAQMLRTGGDELFYYTFRTGDGENGDRKPQRPYEIDFLLSRGDKICPIEVKSSGYKAHKSLDMFQVKYSNRVLECYLIYTKDLRREGNVTYLPVYMATQLHTTKV